jgi:hypothetical protein
MNMEGLAIGPRLANGHATLIGIVDDGGASDPLSTNTLVALEITSPVGPPSVPGDVNFDGSVNAADLARLVETYGSAAGAVWEDGDFNEDGKVGLRDLAALASQFSPAAAATPVPEPGGFCLLVLTLGACACWGQRQLSAKGISCLNTKGYKGRIAMRPNRRRLMGMVKMLLAVVLAASLCSRAFALIFGGEGNKPLQDPGWPTGAAAVFNHTSRVAWWEGPPFGGGNWHAECRGDAKAFNAVLVDFAKMAGKDKRLVVHDGVGKGFWAARTGDAKVDWIFAIWQKGSWDRQRRLPNGIKQPGVTDADDPPATIDVYTGGNIRWADVKIPKGLTVTDNRLEARGFTSADGIVLEGTIIDLATKKPIAGRVRLERHDPQGNCYTLVTEKAADAKGQWVLKNVPAGSHRVVVTADGYLARVAGYAQFEDQPRWFSYDRGLAPAAAVSGRVTDDGGRPLEGVDVRIQHVTAVDGSHYEPADNSASAIKTDAEGRFETKTLPVGTATIWVSKSGYCRPGLGPSIKLPEKDVSLTMVKSGQVLVRVDFTGTTRPGGYIVRFGPEGGGGVGTWGGSGNIDAANQLALNDVPPGRYVFTGRPNPGSDKEQTEPETVDVKGGESIEVILHAK